MLTQMLAYARTSHTPKSLSEIDCLNIENINGWQNLLKWIGNKYE